VPSSDRCALFGLVGCPRMPVSVDSVRARLNTLLGRKKAGLRESNVSLIQLSYMAPLLTQSALRHGIFSWLSLSAVILLPKAWSKDVSSTPRN
jgi:hypothetical protein